MAGRDPCPASVLLLKKTPTSLKATRVKVDYCLGRSNEDANFHGVSESLQKSLRPAVLEEGGRSQHVSQFSIESCDPVLCCPLPARGATQQQRSQRQAVC
jgi:hypothetical protein